MSFGENRLRCKAFAVAGVWCGRVCGEESSWVGSHFHQILVAAALVQALIGHVTAARISA
ncbi:MAG TPA: hypothetical protein VF062_00340 [Candidatus Limnocylindrales bacterium]